MNNIYIVGVPKTGKTTLAKMIKKKMPQMNLISFEAIRNGFIKSQPELKMENKNSMARKEILPSYIFEFINWNKKMSTYGNIIEGSFTTIENIVQNIDKNDIVICLGFNGRSIEEIIDGIIKNDSQEDYTKSWSKEKIKKHFYDIVEEDLKNLQLCKKYKLKYYDTYDNRINIFLEIINWIEEVDK